MAATHLRRRTESDLRHDGEPRAGIYRDGAANYPAPSYDPDTQLFYFNATQSSSVYYANGTDSSMEYHTGLFHSALLALHYETGKVAWRHDYPGIGFWSSTYPGILTTAG